MRVALTQTLERAGFAVETAQDGRLALEAISTGGMPDLITLDVEMPRMNGLETLHAIRHSPGGGAVPIFMISSRSAEHNRQVALGLGATGYFTKPYPVEDLIAAARATRQPAAASGV
jgi:chemosensory pili system protein ChpA (sensor histidine kinase/response regulator)